MPPVKATLFTNGMLMVFDESGQQVPEYQGLGREMIPKLRRDFPEVPVEGADESEDVRPGVIQARLVEGEV